MSEIDLNDFFYTVDNIADKISDQFILEDIKKKYPKLFNEEISMACLKKAFIELVDNENYINSLLDKFDMRFTELFEVLYRQFSVIFENKLFVKKLSAIMYNKSYANRL